MAVVALWLPGCSRSHESAKRAPIANSLSASIPSPTRLVWHYAIEASGAVHVEMQGVKERIMGDATGATGTIDLVPNDLTQSRGQVRVDLSTFSTHTFGNRLYDTLQTRNARAWLEVQAGEPAHEGMRWADFAIRGIETANARDLTAVALTHDGTDLLRTCTMTVHGDLLVHGHEVPKDAVVDVAFRYPAGSASDSEPMRITVRSKRPMAVRLEEHDVRPRDAAGQLLEWTTALLSSVAETANVTVDLDATPTSRPTPAFR
jgi:hypothetical protein